MKGKILILMLTALLPALQGFAATPVHEGIAVRGLRASVDGDSLRIRFRA